METNDNQMGSSELVDCCRLLRSGALFSLMYSVSLILARIRRGHVQSDTGGDDDTKKNGVSVDYQLSICIACTGVFTHILTLTGLPTDITYGATAECCVK